MEGPPEPQTSEPPTDLRPYQVSIVDELVALLEAPRSPPVMVVLPTGGGKTRIAVAVCRHVLQRKERALFVVNRNKLVLQFARACDALGLDGQYAFMKAGMPEDTEMALQIASIQTLYARRDSSDAEDALPAAAVVFLDEAHGAVSQTYAWLLRHYRRTGALVVGLTATPMRLRADEPLSRVFPRLIRGPSIPHLMHLGVLVPTRTFASFQPQTIEIEVSKAAIKASHPSVRARCASVDDAIARPSVELSEDDNGVASVAAVVRLWQRTCGGDNPRPTLIFAVDIAHALQYVRAFTEAGVTAACMSGDTPVAEREALSDALAAGTLTVLSSVNVLSEGFDVPAVAAVVLARPTRSCGLYIQQVGRGLRRHPGKTDCIVIDVVGNTLRHGPVTEARAPSSWKALSAFTEHHDDGSESDRDDASRVQRTLRVFGTAEPRAWVCVSKSCAAVSPTTTRACVACGATKQLSTREADRARGAARRSSSTEADDQITAMLGGMSISRASSTSFSHPVEGGVRKSHAKVSSAPVEERIPIPRKIKAPELSDARPLSAIPPGFANAGKIARVCDSTSQLLVQRPLPISCSSVGAQKGPASLPLPPTCGLATVTTKLIPTGKSNSTSQPAPTAQTTTNALLSKAPDDSATSEPLR